jgi:hypothetical protein
MMSPYRTVKKPVINVDDLEDAGDGSIPSPVTDLVVSAFAIWNMANALVTESASIQGTFIQFHEQIVTSLDSMYFVFTLGISYFCVSVVSWLREIRATEKKTIK